MIKVVAQPTTLSRRPLVRSPDRDHHRQHQECRPEGGQLLNRRIDRTVRVDDRLAPDG